VGVGVGVGVRGSVGWYVVRGTWYVMGSVLSLFMYLQLYRLCRHHQAFCMRPCCFRIVA
jgi:hypothetical protein